MTEAFSIKNFVQKHRVVLIACVGSYIAMVLPATYIQATILNGPISPPDALIQPWQSLFSTFGNGTEALSACSSSYRVWASDMLKWVFYGWLFICRMGIIMLVPAALRYAAFYKMPLANFFITLVLLFIAPIFVALVVSRALPLSPNCSPRPELEIQFFIPILPLALIPYLSTYLIYRKLGQLQSDTTNTNEYTQQSPTP